MTDYERWQTREALKVPLRDCGSRRVPRFETEKEIEAREEREANEREIERLAVLAAHREAAKGATA